MNKSYLICTDLDRTLIPNGPQPESRGAREHFSRLVSSEEIILVYVSGRDKRLVERAIKSYQLPVPDYVVADAGTSIYDMRQTPWSIWTEWHDEISQDWNGCSYTDVGRMLSKIDGLRLQEHRKQNLYKCSFYFPLHLDQQLVTGQVIRKLSEQQIKASLVWSTDEPTGIGLLDVLPQGASKLHAVRFLQQHLGISLNDMLFAGDSSNDLAVMASDIPSVMVANAAADVVGKARQTAMQSGTADALYVAMGGFENMNGNYAAGILEGVEHYYPELSRLYRRAC